MRAKNAIYKRIPRTFCVTTRHGFVFAGTTRDVIQRHVFVFGVWEPNITNFVKSHLRPGDCAVDIGANVGYHSCLFAACVGPTGRVISFEPFGSSFDRLRSNLDRNSFSWVRPIRVAVGESDAEVAIHRAPAGNIGSTTTAERVGYEKADSVTVRRASDLIPDDFAARLRVVKIDVEGDELNALRGLRATLERAPQDCAVIVEISPTMLAERGQRVEELVGLMSDLRYNIYSIPNSYEPAAYLADVVPARPTRCDASLGNLSGDYVFSRIEADYL